MIYLELFFTFFSVGLFTIGGGHAMVPMIQSEVVSKGWATIETVIDFIGIAESTPGPFAINMATFIGNKIGGLLGAACATLGVVTPSFVIILVIAKVFTDFRENKYVDYAFTGLRPTVIALISYATVTIVKNGLDLSISSNGITLEVRSLLIFIIVLIINLLYKKIHPIWLVLISALLGIILFGFL